MEVTRLESTAKGLRLREAFREGTNKGILKPNALGTVDSQLPSRFLKRQDVYDQTRAEATSSQTGVFAKQIGGFINMFSTFLGVFFSTLGLMILYQILNKIAKTYGSITVDQVFYLFAAISFSSSLQFLLVIFRPVQRFLLHYEIYIFRLALFLAGSTGCLCQAFLLALFPQTSVFLALMILCSVFGFSMSLIQAYFNRAKVYGKQNPLMEQANLVPDAAVSVVDAAVTKIGQQLSTIKQDANDTAALVTNTTGSTALQNITQKLNNSRSLNMATAFFVLLQAGGAVSSVAVGNYPLVIFLVFFAMVVVSIFFSFARDIIKILSGTTDASTQARSTGVLAGLFNLLAQSNLPLPSDMQSNLDAYLDVPGVPKSELLPTPNQSSTLRNAASQRSLSLTEVCTDPNAKQLTSLNGHHQHLQATLLSSATQELELACRNTFSFNATVSASASLGRSVGGAASSEEITSAQAVQVMMTQNLQDNNPIMIPNARVSSSGAAMSSDPDYAGSQAQSYDGVQPSVTQRELNILDHIFYAGLGIIDNGVIDVIQFIAEHIHGDGNGGMTVVSKSPVYNLATIPEKELQLATDQLTKTGRSFAVPSNTSTSREMLEAADQQFLRSFNKNATLHQRTQLNTGPMTVSEEHHLIPEIVVKQASHMRRMSRDVIVPISRAQNTSSSVAARTVDSKNDISLAIQEIPKTTDSHFCYNCGAPQYDHSECPVPQQEPRDARSSIFQVLLVLFVCVSCSLAHFAQFAVFLLPTNVDVSAPNATLNDSTNAVFTQVTNAYNSTATDADNIRAIFSSFIDHSESLIILLGVLINLAGQNVLNSGQNKWYHAGVLLPGIAAASILCTSYRSIPAVQNVLMLTISVALSSNTALLCGDVQERAPSILAPSGVQGIADSRQYLNDDRFRYQSGILFFKHAFVGSLMILMVQLRLNDGTKETRTLVLAIISIITLAPALILVLYMRLRLRPQRLLEYARALRMLRDAVQKNIMSLKDIQQGIDAVSDKDSTQQGAKASSVILPSPNIASSSTAIASRSLKKTASQLSTLRSQISESSPRFTFAQNIASLNTMGKQAVNAVLKSAPDGSYTLHLNLADQNTTSGGQRSVPSVSSLPDFISSIPVGSLGALSLSLMGGKQLKLDDLHASNPTGQAGDVILSTLPPSSPQMILSDVPNKLFVEVDQDYLSSQARASLSQAQSGILKRLLNFLLAIVYALFAKRTRASDEEDLQDCLSGNAGDIKLFRSVAANYDFFKRIVRPQQATQYCVTPCAQQAPLNVTIGTEHIESIAKEFASSSVGDSGGKRSVDDTSSMSEKDALSMLFEPQPKVTFDGALMGVAGRSFGTTVGGSTQQDNTLEQQIALSRTRLAMQKRPGQIGKSNPLLTIITPRHLKSAAAVSDNREVNIKSPSVQGRSVSSVDDASSVSGADQDEKLARGEPKCIVIEEIFFTLRGEASVVRSIQRTIISDYFLTSAIPPQLPDGKFGSEDITNSSVSIVVHNNTGSSSKQTAFVASTASELTQRPNAKATEVSRPLQTEQEGQYSGADDEDSMQVVMTGEEDDFAPATSSVGTEDKKKQ